MKYQERKMNLFSVPKKYYLAHCIAADLKMSAGIAVEFQRRFHLRGKIKKWQEFLADYEHYGERTCIQTGRVFNLITKAKSSGKPTYLSIARAIYEMKCMVDILCVRYLAMPKIGCGLDRLSWPKVRSIIQEEFKALPTEILVCHL